MTEHPDFQNDDTIGAVLCATCGDPLPVNEDSRVSPCVNVGNCYAADVAAVPAPGERMKAPQAFTIRGNVD